MTQKEWLLQIADNKSPKEAALEAWELITVAALNHAKSAGASIEGSDSKKIVDYLQSTGQFSLRSQGLFYGLHVLYYRASHEDYFLTNRDEVEQYIDLTIQSASEIDTMIKS